MLLSTAFHRKTVSIVDTKELYSTTFCDRVPASVDSLFDLQVLDTAYPSEKVGRIANRQLHKRDLLRKAAELVVDVLSRTNPAPTTQASPVAADVCLKEFEEYLKIAKAPVDLLLFFSALAPCT